VANIEGDAKGASMKNPYGLLDGKLVVVDEVARGLDCRCFCPACGHPLEARKGGEKAHHFAHYEGADCGAGYQTALHLLAKEVIADERRLLLPELKVHPDQALLKLGTFATPVIVVKPWVRVEIDSVRVEKALGGIVPDVLVEAKGRRLIVEIYVSHPVGPKKLAAIRDMNVAAVEFNFSTADRRIGRDEIRRALIETYRPTGNGRGSWLHHPDWGTAQEVANRRYVEDQLTPPKVPEPPEQRELFP
jgi:hypothetical protein